MFLTQKPIASSKVYFFQKSPRYNQGKNVCKWFARKIFPNKNHDSIFTPTYVKSKWFWEFINLTLSWRRPISYRNQSIDLRSMKGLNALIHEYFVVYPLTRTKFTETWLTRILENNAFRGWQEKASWTNNIYQECEYFYFLLPCTLNLVQSNEYL